MARKTIARKFHNMIHLRSCNDKMVGDKAKYIEFKKKITG